MHIRERGLSDEEQFLNPHVGKLVVLVFGFFKIRDKKLIVTKVIVSYPYCMHDRIGIL